MAADRPVSEEFLALLFADPAELERAVGSERGDWPPLAGGEGLPQEGEIRERGHDLDAGLGLEAVAQGIEVELGLQVVHAGLEDRFAVEGDPEPDGPRPGQVREHLVGEIVLGLLRGEVEIGEDDDARDRMLQDLGPPARMSSRVESLAEQEAQPG